MHWLSRCSVFYFREPTFPTKSLMEPRYRDGTLVNPDSPWSNPDSPWCLRIPIPTGISNGTTLQWNIELLEHPLRSYNPKVFKTVKVIKKDTVTAVKVDRRCLFAVDVQMDCPTSGFFFSTPQQEGLKCPCCRRTQQQCYSSQCCLYDFEEPSENVGTENRRSITLELEPPQPQSQRPESQPQPDPEPEPQEPKSSSTHSVAVAKVGPVYFATASSTRATFIWHDQSHSLVSPETIAALESMAGYR